MNQITIKLPDSTFESLEEVAKEQHQGNRSQAIRDLVNKGLEHSELERDLEHKEARIQELRNQITARNNEQEQVQELAKQVEEYQMSVDAPFFVRWYHWYQQIKS